MAQSQCIATSPSKPQKPSPDFPLFAHATKRWAKKIRGRMHYFGPWDDPEGALSSYKAQADALHAGKKPREVEPEGVTIRELCNTFHHAKQVKLDSRELSPRTFADYKAITDLIVSHFKKDRLMEDVGPDDFGELRQKLAKRLGPHALKRHVQMIRTVFSYGFERWSDEAPRFGPDFSQPSQKTIRLHRAAQGKKLFTAGQVRSMIDAAGVHLKAMIYLGINCGMGNSDCGNLPSSAVDLAGGWHTFHRPKTGIERRCPLWPETVQALKDSMALRPTPKRDEDRGLVFLTRGGASWAKNKADNPLAKEAAKLLKALGIVGGFYWLRHTFQTIGDEAKDFVATRFLMGHADSSISAMYREDVSDERLRAVVEHVRTWLLADAHKNGKGTDNA